MNSQTPRELLRSLEEKPFGFDFFQALRLLECLHPDQPRLGESLRPSEDPVRLAQEPSLAFAPSTLSGFRHHGSHPVPRLTQQFFGLFGPNGPLPLHLTEYARDRWRNSDDPTFARFADIFHHRLLSLFYRVWARSQPTSQFDRPESDRFALYVGALFGLGTPELQARDAMPDLAKLHFAGLLACQTRHAGGLQAILAGFFAIRVEVQEFVGHWMELPENCRCRLGDASNGTLGHSATIGARVWDCQFKFRICLGPMDYAEFERLLPGGDSMRRLTAIVANYAGPELLWDVNLILNKDQVPAVRLGQAGCLGWTTWLANCPFAQDADDLVLNPTTHPPLAA
jgi:type VI secretion system protein ImpH